MRLNPLLAVAASAMALLAAAPAAAASMMMYTYQGVVAEGLDQTGVFGAAGRNLAGLSFTAVFLRHDVPGATIYSDESGSAISGFGSDSPLRGWLAIDGGPQRAFGSSFGLQTVGRGCDGSCLDSFVQEARTSAEVLTASYRYYQNDYLSLSGDAPLNTLPSLDYRDLPSLGPDGPVVFRGGFQVFTELFDHEASSMVSTESARGVLSPLSLTVARYVGDTGPVPEPGAWALMILGFGAAGAMLRRRRMRPA